MYKVKPFLYDETGYNVYGYDKRGFDRNGYNINGVDRNGFELKGNKVISPANYESSCYAGTETTWQKNRYSSSRESYLNSKNK